MSDLIITGSQNEPDAVSSQHIINDDYIELQSWLEETKDEPLETMAGFFDARIDSYEEHMSRWSGHYKRMAELIPGSVHSLLDIGCGTGLELEPVYEKIPGISVTGIDLSEKMLSKLKEKFTGKSPRLICGDYFSIDFGTECYDAVISFETLHHVDAQIKTGLYKKVYSCLKPGGIYLECDYIASIPEIEELVFSEYARRCARDRIQNGVFVHFDTPLTLEHECNAMKAGGLVIESVEFLPQDGHTPIITAKKY